MPSFADSIFIFVLALMLFGPKKLPQLARQIGKLMAEFRRASNEFRMQMEDEMRVEEQKEHQAKVDAMAGPAEAIALPEHPHGDNPLSEEAVLATAYPDAVAGEASAAGESALPVEPLPIAESGGLKMMPPSTGLPVESNVGRLYDDAPSMNGSVAGSAEYVATDGDGLEAGHDAVPAGIPVAHAGFGSSSEEPASERPASAAVQENEGVNA